MSGQDNAVSPVSDERLKQIVAYVELMGPNSEPCVPGDVAQSMAAELLSRRSLDTTDGVEHPDDEAVDRFAAAMKAKLKWERDERGRGGWQQMSADDLSRLLVEHLPKADPVDVANFCMMLHQNGQSIASPTPNTEVVVKALEWHGPDLDDEYYSKTMLGTYSIGSLRADGTRWSMGQYHPSVEAAKAAAQADFDQRIRSALASPPSPAQTVTDEMVKRATIEFLSHKGERPMRVTRGGWELWEGSTDAMRAALIAALAQHSKEG